MCLSTVTSHKYEGYVLVEAYKCFVKNEDGSYQGLFYDNSAKYKSLNPREYYLGEVYTAKPWLLVAIDNNTYCAGFHSFASLEEAKDYAKAFNVDNSNAVVVCLVHLSRIHAVGDQNGRQVIVSQEMKIVEEIK